MKIKDVKREAAKLGATVELSAGTIYVDAPQGKVWNASDGHFIAEAYDTRGHRFEEEAVRRTLDRMGRGLRDCGELECDICHD